MRADIVRAIKRWLLEAWIAFPWALLAWLGAVIGCQRWAHWEMGLSLGVTVAAAVAGWHLVGRAGRRIADVQLGDLLAQVPDATPGETSLHRVQTIKQSHFAQCQRRWGVTPATSGWERFRHSWWKEMVCALVCAAVSVHPWWLGV